MPTPRDTRVYTTIDGRLQHAANAALRQGLMEYDVRHGYRGPERRAAPGEDAGSPEGALAGVPTLGGLLPALVTSADRDGVTAYARGVGPIRDPVREHGMGPPLRRHGPPGQEAGIGRRGGAGRRRHPHAAHRKTAGSFSQIPDVEGALVSLDPHDGAIVALTGWLRFLPQQVQPRDAGRTPAGVELQAVHLLRRARARLHRRQHHQRRAGGLRGSKPRERVAAGELRRQVPGSDQSSNRAVPVAQPRLDPAPARHRHRLRLRAYRQIRARRGASAARLVARARQRGADAARGRSRIRRARQRRIRGRAVLHRARARRGRHDPVHGGPARGVPRLRR